METSIVTHFDVGEGNPGYDQGVYYLTNWMKAWVQLLNYWVVVRDDVVATNSLRFLEHLKSVSYRPVGCVKDVKGVGIGVVDYYAVNLGNLVIETISLSVED